MINHCPQHTTHLLLSYFKQTKTLVLLSKKTGSMGTEGFGLEITELRLGLPGGGGGERNDKKRAFLDILGDGKNWSTEMAVGWPPVCSYRKKSSAIAKLYVKVSMDGAPFLRKIDINGFKGYSDFVMALENLFGLGDACEYIPIYEDKDGDWMLVGDVPWGMFIETCKRLRMKKRVVDGGLQTKNLMTKD